MKVTIITSVFNGGEFLPDFLSNIEQQTIYDDCKHFLVCCNPTRGEDEEICLDWAQKHNNVEFHYQNPDPGIYEVWNQVCKAAETPYITNANVDDRLFPKSLEKHVELLDNKPWIDLAYCKNVSTGIPNDTLDSDITRPVYPTAPFNPKLMLRGNLPHNHPVWRASLHERFGYFDTSIFSAADWEFWLRCVVGGSVFELIPLRLGLYYWNPNGISTRGGPDFQKKVIAEARVRKQYQGPINALCRKNLERQREGQKV